jgi:hypothetical protein
LCTRNAAGIWAVDLFSTTYFGEIIIFVVSKDQTFRIRCTLMNPEQFLILVPYLLLLTVHDWTLGVQIKIGMLLAAWLDLLESRTVIIWYIFLSKKDSTIALYEGIPYLIFNHWFNVQFLSISLIFYSNVINLCLIYPNHHILSDRTSKIYTEIN